MKYGLLWLLGVPIPLLIIGYLLFHWVIVGALIALIGALGGDRRVHSLSLLANLVPSATRKETAAKLGRTSPPRTD